MSVCVFFIKGKLLREDKNILNKFFIMLYSPLLKISLRFRYLIVFILSYIVPKMFVGIAFDAGGVATGPMTATFILAFVQGAAYSNPGSHPILDGLGMIALVAMMQIITLQILGVIFKIKTRKVGIDDAK